jgi:hypothetical protein
MTINGDVRGIKFGLDTNNAGVVTGSMLTITPDAVTNLIQRLSLTYGALVENSLGLIAYGSVGTNNKVKFAQMTPATGHMLRPRGNTGCVWNPVGNVSFRTDEFNVAPFKYQGQICPDVFWGTCLEKLMGVGNNIEDLLGNPESRMILLELLNSIFESLGDSIHNIAWFAEHPLINEANTKGTYLVDEEEWANFKAQQLELGVSGWMTIMEGLRAEGVPNYNVEIFEADVNDSNTYTGSVGRAGGLFERLTKGGSKTMRTLNSRTIKGGVTGANTGRQTILVTREIFEAYERELSSDFPHIPATYYYHISQKFVNQFGLEGIISQNDPVNGVLMWKGHYVKLMENWDLFYDICGYDAHIAIMAAQGTLGLATDVTSLEQYSGLGMVIEQDRKAPNLGKIFMHTNFRMGMGITNPDLVTYASLILPKA